MSGSGNESEPRGVQAMRITCSAVGSTVANRRRMRLAILLFALSGCADWFEADTCGGPYVRITSSPDTPCLNLAGGAAKNGEGDRIVGRNDCTQTFVIDTMSFPIGGSVLIPLDDATASHEGADSIWTLSGTLGTAPVTLTATKSPC